MGKVTKQTIRKRVRELFDTEDLETLTERKVRNKLQEEYGADVSEEHLAVVKDEIEDILEELAGESEPEAEAGAKVTGSEYALTLGKNKKLTVRVFNKKVLIDLREFFTDKEGVEKPTAKGLALSYSAWLRLSSALPQLHEAVDKGDTDYVVELAHMRRASVSEFKGRTNVQVREYYLDDGELKPTKKGMALDQAALKALMDHVTDVSAFALKLGATPDAAADVPSTAVKKEEAGVKAEPGAVKAEQQAGVKAEPGVVKAEPGSVAGSSGAGAAGKQAAAGAGEAGAASVIDLGGEKRVTLSTFSGKPMVDLREWYRKGSELAPGKKGISLKLEEWRTLVRACGDISAAVKAKDMGYELTLAPKRKVTLSEFKGKLYVGVREFYSKDGKELPGAKGLSMSAEQWQKLAQGQAAFTAAAVPAE